MTHLLSTLGGSQGPRDDGQDQIYNTWDLIYPGLPPSLFLTPIPLDSPPAWPLSPSSYKALWSCFHFVSNYV